MILSTRNINLLELMAKINLLILLPVYNDWRSLNKLLIELDRRLDTTKFIISILIVDDASNEAKKMNNHNLKNINNIKVIRFGNNMGNQKAIFLGLKYIHELNYKGIIAVMDADGEDDPAKLGLLVKKLIEKKNNFIVAARKSRTENIIFRLLNNLRLIITYFLTGKYINFGNFSCFNSYNLKKIFHNNSNHFAYCSIIAKNKITKVFIDKKKRYFEKSKASYKFLFLHSINILTEFSSTVIIRSLIFIFMLTFFRDLTFVSFLIVGLLILNAIILLNLVYNNYL